jgi:hypothetical protein
LRSASPFFSAAIEVVGPQSKSAGPSLVSSGYDAMTRSAWWCRSMGPVMRALARFLGGGAGCRTHESRLEIGDQVVGGLDPDGEANEVPRRGERSVGRRRVRHPCWMLDQALDAAE